MDAEEIANTSLGMIHKEKGKLTQRDSSSGGRAEIAFDKANSDPEC